MELELKKDLLKLKGNREKSKLVLFAKKELQKEFPQEFGAAKNAEKNLHQMPIT